MIKEIALKNFKSHSISKVKLHSGLNIFIGEVGAGKTSVLEAISFAFFGSYAGSMTKRALISRGAKRAEVDLTFSAQNEDFKVKRVIYPKKTQKAQLWVIKNGNPKLLVEGATAVTRSIEDLLEVDTSTFMAAFYASQGVIKEMLETQPGKRRERLDKLLGINVYENIWKILGDARSLVLNNLTEAQEKASGFNLLEKQLADFTSQHERKNQEIWTLKTLLKDIESRLEPVEQRLDELKKLEIELKQMETLLEAKKSEIENTSNTIISLEGKIKEGKKAREIYQKNKQFIKEVTALEDKKRQIKTSLQQKENLKTILGKDESNLKDMHQRRERISENTERITELYEKLLILSKKISELPQLENERDTLSLEFENLINDVAKREEEIDSYDKRLYGIINLRECPTCLQVVPKEHKQRIERHTKESINQLRIKLQTKRKDKEKIQNSIKEINGKIEHALIADKEHAKLSEQVKLLEQHKNEIEDIDQKILKLTKDIEKNKQGINQIKDTSNDLILILQKIEEVKIKAQLANEAEKIVTAQTYLQEMLEREKQNLSELKNQFEDLNLENIRIQQNYDFHEHRNADETVKILHNDGAKTNEGIRRLSNTLEELEIKIKETNKQFREKGKAWEQVEKLKVQNRVTEILRNSLREVVQPLKRKNSVLNVSNVFHTYYQELSNDNIDYAEIDEDGNVDIVRNGEPSPVNSLSGGETTCAALALRLAICSSLTKNQMLLLDEPTIHLDELYRGKLRDFLGTHRFDHLIVVTHDNTFDSLPAHIFRVEKRRNQSVISPLNSKGNELNVLP